MSYELLMRDCMGNCDKELIVPEGWRRVKLGEVLAYEQPNNYIVKSENYDKDSGIPVLTPGKALILGYTDEIFGIFKDVPIILFDDFTTQSRYVNFPFKVKSSAVKILKLKNTSNNIYLVYNIMQILNFKPGSEHKRFWISEYSEIKILLPTPSEQQRIAEILETVDNAIEKTGQIIEKYKRIKQGLMHDLLTKGVTVDGDSGGDSGGDGGCDGGGESESHRNQSPSLSYRLRDEKRDKFKDSPLGRIPEEWEVVSIYDCVKIINGGTPSTSVPEYWNGKIPWLSVEDFNTGKRWVISSSKYITDLGLKKSATRILKKGMLIISARGTVGVLAQLGEDMAFNQTSYGLDSKNKNNLTNDFLYYSLKNYISFYLSLSYGNVFDTITRNTFKEIKIPLPPLPEQQRIAEILSQIDEAIEKETAYKEKLQRLKLGLMEDLLTGKVRVNHLIKEKN